MIQIVFQNSDFVVVEKPDGLDFHSTPQKPPGLAVLVQQQLQQPVYPVHRLDKMTSGLVIFALTKSAAQQFERLFRLHQVEKIYLAISTQKPRKKQGWVKGDMVAARRGSWKLTKDLSNPAMTQFISQNTQPHERWFLLKPLTGKTHQLRVALKSLGSPIAGDQRYANSDSAKEEDRGYLHAYALRFEWQGQTFEWVCQPTQGVRFLSDAGQRPLAAWQDPFVHFVKGIRN
ncbi:MAG: TIGR01621 family pseudouridine synthase [Thiomicrospira sp.]|nr:TIGR01621 family pseudouridine synthase [Thiomicrospira sp.]OIP93795.1 MAG: RNA pseudouridine synthase [Thiomicrospira sp. CG2_30_44_34]PIU37799.1 MAG: TIGR01621 family pseudouridine synthase [Piscirickettsiaceae bacterium CG07_land_8_20_14_0_80_44_28]NCN65993.1 TIGR01621 family pseudouridine synthase [Thiomicrospira sp.]NCO14611.1 TIGR01621 family pseudouridine synthase [Thiomicrospira sp.]